MRITRVVTKTGDGGDTALARGPRLPKSSLRVSAYGDVDELNSWLGVVRAHPIDPRLGEMLEEIQHQLFVLGADLATPGEFEGTRIEKTETERLEAMLEELLSDMDPLKEFVIPGGGPAGAFLHLARTVSRRAERSVVALQRAEATPSGSRADASTSPAPARASVSAEVLVYLNRLSDLLFVMARVANRRAGSPETLAVFAKKPTPPSMPPSTPPSTDEP